MARLVTGATAIIVLLCCTVVSSEPRDEEVFRLPPELEGRARIVKVQAPRAPDSNAKAMGGLAEWEAPTHPADIVVEVINDEAVERGVTATGPAYEALVFSQMLDSGYGWFLDNTPGTVQWSQMIFGNGFTPGDELSSFVARVYVSAHSFGSFNISAGFTLELWDGDPLGLQDTTCSVAGVPAPIPGTMCTWTDLPEATVYDLKCVFPEKVTINCDRVFGLVWPGDVCRWAWRISKGYIHGGAINSPQIGAGDAMGAVWACEQFGYCDTPSGYNAGTCCEEGEACDHTDPDPANWTPEGGCTLYGGIHHATLCQDDAADYYFTASGATPEYYANFVGQAFARTDVVMQVVPMSVDVIPGTGPLPSDVTIDGNTVTIDQPYPGGERHLWLEIYVSDWDPGDTGTTVKAWQAGLDASGYAAGLDCTLEPWTPTCATDADCIALQGEVGTAMDALKGGCSLLGMLPNQCAAAFAPARPDFIFYMQGHMGGIDQSTWNYRYGATLFGLPIQSPHIGDMYLGSLTLKTSCDCPAGEFSVGMTLPNSGSNMVQGDLQFIPLLGVRGADIIFPMGQCCNISEDPIVCISDTVTRCECERMGIDGGFGTYFHPRLTCMDLCFGCNYHEYSCADDDACTVNRCVDDWYCETIPVAVGADECCDYLTYDLSADMAAYGAITFNDDGNQCTANVCDDPGMCALGDQCGVPYNPPLDAGETCHDGEPCETVYDQCDGDGNCVGTPISSVPCTSNADCESITLGVGSCDLATGFCQCPASFCGNGIVESGETCDDGNPDNSDGCSSTCTVEDGWNCTGYPSVCTPVRVPTVSEWGLIVMTLMLAAGAKVYFNRRRSARA